MDRFHFEECSTEQWGKRDLVQLGIGLFDWRINSRPCLSYVYDTRIHLRSEIEDLRSVSNYLLAREKVKEMTVE